MKRQKLIVEVVEARNLVAKDGQGFSSPYVAVDFYGQRKRTRTAVRDLSPTWNESLEFNAEKPSEVFEDVLELSVFHDKTFGPTRRNTFLGRLRLAASQFVDKGEEALVYLPLQKKHLFNWVHGDIGLRIYFAADAEPEKELKPVPPSEGQSTGDAVDPKPTPEDLVQPDPEAQSKSVPPSEGQKDVVEPEPEPHVDSNPLPEGQKSNDEVEVDSEPKAKPQLHDEAEPPDTIAASVILKPPPPPVMVPEIKLVGEPINTTLQPIRRRISSDESESRERTERSTFDLVEKMHHVFVRVVKARSLPLETAPTVKVSMGNHHFKSKPATRPVVPSPFFVWDQTFAFSSCGHDVLEVSVWDDCGSFLGGVCFDVAEAPVRDPPDSPLAPQWYRMEGSGAHHRGDLMLATWAGTQADESFADAWKTGTALNPAVYHSPKLWYLRVSVLEAQGLVGSSESFFRLRARLGAQLAKTRPVTAQNGPPVWNEDLIFVAAEPFDDDDAVTITLETGKGSAAKNAAVVPLCTVERRVDERRVASRWYSLGGGGESVHLRVCFDGGYHVADEATHATSDYRPSARQLWNPPVGSLDLGIVSFRAFAPKNTAAYCLAKYGPKWVRTRTVVSDDPRWNEQYRFDVFDPCTVLTLAVFDSEDRPLGKVRVRISTLSAGKVHRSTYPLARTGELDLAIRFIRTAPSTIDLLKVYFQPSLPAMHYLKPLGSSSDGLRLAATRAVAARLSGKSEPPLRREAVLYVLLDDTASFSMTRVRENYARIVRSAAPLIEAARWAHETRQWKSSAATFLVHVLLVLFVWFPELVFPTAAFYVSASIAWNFRRRGRLRWDPHSPAEEELDETYERLRAVGARVQALLGEAAAQGERVHSLLTWGDPRATGIFVAACIAAGAVTCLVPPKMGAVAVGFYYMRHPVFRDRMPSPVFIFFRRLPVAYYDSHPVLK